MRFLLGMMLVLLGAQVGADAAPPIEAYGALPEIRSVALSPDGAHVAYLLNKENLETLNVYEFGEGYVGAVRTDEVKAREVFFAGPDHVILVAGKTMRIFGYRGQLENSAAFSYSLNRKKVVRLPKDMDELYPAQEGLGRIIGLYEDGEHILMPAYMGTGSSPPYDLLRIDLDSGGGRRIKRGQHDTHDWIVEPDGTILARVDYDNKSNMFQISTERDGRMVQMYETESPRIPFGLRGVKPDKSGLLLIADSGARNYSTLFELGFDGRIKGPVFARKGSDVERLVVDINRVALGAEYAGFYPQYEFFDQKLNTAVNALQNYFTDSAVYLESWTDDLMKLLVYVEGGNTSGAYYIFHRDAGKLEMIANVRPAITPEHVAEVQTINYPARDGLSIPALLTLPLNAKPENAPLIVMPHGGPEAHDTVGFDWMAQYFASRGYMVFQPNFRGSDGFGVEFRDAGRGEWGGKMQDDITDGVELLIESGRADPSRICIVGGSYGGYAALAGGAYTPHLYKCVAAFAPVADLPLMLRTELRDYGSRHWVVDYWQELIGDPRAEKEKLEAISPVNSTATFTAPVLLIHGLDDTVVPINQSRAMERALKASGKQVELVTLKGEDHWLSTSETRLETLKALDAFVTRHIGSN